MFIYTVSFKKPLRKAILTPRCYVILSFIWAAKANSNHKDECLNTGEISLKSIYSFWTKPFATKPVCLNYLPFAQWKRAASYQSDGNCIMYTSLGIVCKLCDCTVGLADRATATKLFTSQLLWVQIPHATTVSMIHILLF